MPGASNRSGLFWFFNESNWEMLVKVVDGTKLDGHWWVYAAAATDVEWDLKIEDLVGKTTWSYVSELGERTSLADTRAFSA